MTRISSVRWALIATVTIAIGAAYGQPAPEVAPNIAPTPVAAPPPGGFTAGGGAVPPGFAPGSSAPARLMIRRGPDGATFLVEEQPGHEASQEQRQAREAVESALRKRSAAETDEQRSAAETELRQAVVQQFDLMVQAREAQIEELKTRLEKLNEQLQSRRNTKDEIVDLRVQVLINESQGLGFDPEGRVPESPYRATYNGRLTAPARSPASVPLRHP